MKHKYNYTSQKDLAAYGVLVSFAAILLVLFTIFGY